MLVNICNEQMEDRAGKEYWEEMWVDKKPAELLSQSNYIVDKVLNKVWHYCLDDYIKNHDNVRLIEIGCGGSCYLPYFNKEFGIEVYGLDYTESGCNSAKEIASYYGVEATILKGDMFSPPRELINQFDIVVSLGVIEHYEDTGKVCKSLYDFVKPGGMCITFLPNTSSKSIMFGIQKFLDKDVYDIHVSLNKQMIQEGHENSGFKTFFCDYLLRSHYGVLHISKKVSLFKKIIQIILCKYTTLVMRLKRNKVKGNAYFSPYIIYVGLKK